MTGVQTCALPISHWQCDALPTEPLPPVNAGGGAESQIRTGDTALFRRVLYQLSYLGPLTASLAAPDANMVRIAVREIGRNGVSEV